MFPGETASFLKIKNLKNIKGQKTVNFLSLIDQKLMKTEKEKLSIDNILRTILDCVD